MTAPTNAAEVQRHLGQLSLDLWNCVLALEAADLDAVNKRERFDMAYSSAFIRADGSVDARKHQAVIETHEQRLEAAVADALVRHLIRRMKALDKRVEVGRSTSSWHKAELSLVQSGVET